MDTFFFCVFDSAAGRYLDPFCSPTPEVAIRGFKHVVNQDGHAFNEAPADYTLFQVGQFDPETGMVLPLTAPVSLGNAVQYLEAPVFGNTLGTYTVEELMEEIQRRGSVEKGDMISV
jgi:hypothetical protein